MKGRFVVIGADTTGRSATSEARRTDAEMEMVARDKGHLASCSQCAVLYEGVK